jgi:hypothetical protein
MSESIILMDSFGADEETARSIILFVISKLYKGQQRYDLRKL